MADLESLEKALAASPDNLPLILLIGTEYLNVFRLDDARHQFDAALRIDPSNSEAKLGIIHSLELGGKPSEAIIRAEQLCSDVPGFARAWFTRAKLALSDTQPEEAERFYNEALRLDPACMNEDFQKRLLEALPDPADEGFQDEKPLSLGAHDWQPGIAGEEEDDDYEEELEVAIRRDFLQKNKINFSDVGGMEDVKEDIRMKIIYPFQDPEVFKAYGKSAGGGVLLYGPPGCGKTLISRATAGEIKANFLSIGLHQVLDMWLGKSEEKLHQIFEFARKRSPAVIFFDEIDALAADRKDLRTSAGRTLINQFLAELDSEAADNEGLLILGATNAPWHLDSAFLRPGRFDRIIFVPPPDIVARKEIIDVMSKGKPLESLDAAALAKKTAGFSGADLMAVFDQAIEGKLAEAMKRKSIVPVSQSDLVKSAKRVKPSTVRWFESARNYALYANQSGLYDDVLEHLENRS